MDTEKPITVTVELTLDEAIAAIAALDSCLSSPKRVVTYDFGWSARAKIEHAIVEEDENDSAA